MKNVYSFYKENIEAYTRRSNSLKKKIHLMGSIRLALVAALICCIWLLRNESPLLLTIVTIAFIIPFALLMWYHNKLYAKKEYSEALIKLNTNELNGLDYDFSAFDGAPEKSSSEHDFSLDLDLFGNRSIFQSVNRTVTIFGRELLASWFMSPLTQKEAILKRQEAVKELSTLSGLRQHFYVTGIKQTGSKNDLQMLSTLVNGKLMFANSPLWKALVWIVPGLWLLITTACLLNIISYSVLSIYLLISLFIAYLRSKQINNLYNSVDKMNKIFSIYSKLMESIEGDQFQSSELISISKELSHTDGTASHTIKKLSQYIGGLDQRFSAAGIILNILYLRDTRFAISLEKWKMEHADHIKHWIDALAHFDALSSLGGFAFNHPDYIYPDIANNYFEMEGKALGHPLLNRDVCIKNDINIEKSPWFLIITGANMAGKSTYLRTVGVNYLLACIGTPVYAESLTVYPAKMVTSLRTSDSLVSNESYFFAELKRLKMIIDRLQQGEKLFIILDEILKGTNSIDKQKGSIALMKQLVSYKTCGIIATHDLVLGNLEKEFPEQIKNYRFEADIKDDELSFSYKLHEGIAENMNACFLMKRMGITI
ncbi:MULTISPECIES: MutS-related protein [Parabacteroides]|uniref:MutS-related protein n=1 Tax=Parabacteroides provencensis TaxID=1944636 RepID=UPI000C1503CC|nr:DNA mismatch repair protein MutS [Parabacteroides provencensis]